jgi:hypothetical protein
MAHHERHSTAAAVVHGFQGNAQAIFCRYIAAVAAPTCALQQGMPTSEGDWPPSFNQPACYAGLIPAAAAAAAAASRKQEAGQSNEGNHSTTSTSKPDIATSQSTAQTPKQPRFTSSECKQATTHPYFIKC